MAADFLNLDEVPTFSGDESVPEQIQALQNYLFSMRQTLQYLLTNLGKGNFNSTALHLLQEEIKSQLAMEQIVRKTSSGYEMGSKDTVLNLVGTILINGKLFTQEDTNETT